MIFYKPSWTKPILLGFLCYLWGLYAIWRHHIFDSNLIIDLPAMTLAIHSRTSSLKNCGTVLRTLNDQTWIFKKWSYSTSSGFNLKQTPKIHLAFNILWREGWPLPSKLLVHEPSCPFFESFSSSHLTSSGLKQTTRVHLLVSWISWCHVCWDKLPVN